MADHPNAALVRSGYAAFESGDMAKLTDLFDPNVVWHLSNAGPLSGDHRGRDAVFGAFAQTSQLTGGTFKIEVHDVVGNDDHVVALTRATASREGKQYNSRDIDVYHVSDGKVVEFWSFTEDSAAANDFWS